MPTTTEEIHAAVEQRFAQVARSPEQERKFPVGPASANKPGYDPPEIDGLPPSVTASFCGVGDPLGLGEAPDDVSGTFFHRPACGERPHVLVHYRCGETRLNPGPAPAS
jgi:hypothetical protein